MNYIISKTIRKLNLGATLMLGLAIFSGGVSYVLASATSSFKQTINPGTLTADIVDASYVTVANPQVTMSAKTFDFSCQTSTGTFGTATEQIYVKNPDASDTGWTLAIAASSPTDVWDSAGTDFDFNDPDGTGCTDGAGDADSLGGQMTINPSTGTLAKGACLSCNTTGVTLGTSASFNEGTTDSITILSGAANSSDIGDWKVTGVSISQKIPAEQPAANDYTISLTLTATAI